MKIGITTVYKAENCGSFLQAWALSKTLSKMGHEPYFLKYNNSFKAKYKKAEGFVKCCLRLRFKRAKGILNKTHVFKNLRKMLKVTNIGNSEIEMYVFGSDTIWNFDDEFFNTKAAFFTGLNVNKPCYGYSVSVGSTSEETFSKNQLAINAISKFKKIAVRDEHSANVISKFYPQENIVRTVDPTMLMKKEDYINNFSLKNVPDKKYIAVYYFGVIPNRLWQNLKNFARNKNLEIINIGLFENQYDYSLVPSPKNFISAFSNAEYVLTNTFHGCVFSALFNKNFATNGTHKKKVEEFLKQFSLDNRAIVDDDVEKVFTQTVNYEEINCIIERERNKSLDYLNTVVFNEDK